MLDLGQPLWDTGGIRGAALRLELLSLPRSFSHPYYQRVGETNIGAPQNLQSQREFKLLDSSLVDDLVLKLNFLHFSL